MTPTSPKLLAISKYYKIDNNPKSLLHILTKQLHKVKAEYKVRERRLLQIFPEVPKSQNSSLVLVGAPAQGYRSPLVFARTKCPL
jgi:hypothetical protein